MAPLIGSVSIQTQSPSKNLYSPRFVFVLKVYEVPVPFDLGLTLCLVVAPLATVESVTDLTAKGFPRPHFRHCHVVLWFEGLQVKRFDLLRSYFKWFRVVSLNGLEFWKPIKIVKV